MIEVVTRHKGKITTFERLNHNDTRSLARTALAQMGNGFKPTHLIGIKRGGKPVAEIISKEVGLPMHTIHFTRYKGINSSGGMVVKKKLDIDLKKNDKILLIDDVSESGDTLIAAKAHLIEKGALAENIKTLTLHQKPWTQLKPDYVGEHTEKWIIYPWPWELKETKEELRVEIPEEHFSKLFKD